MEQPRLYGFNRAAMALNYLMHENVGIPCTHYFDDYTIIVPEALGSSADELTGRFLKELGWEVKREKDKPTSDTFTSLGSSSR